MNRYIFNAIETLLADRLTPPGRELLDLSAGDGSSSLRYREMGFAVTCTAYDTASIKCDGLGAVQVDLRRRLPFEAASFDIVCLQEVVEYLDHIPAVLDEIHRVLRPGGVLILTTPNMLNARSRLRFLLSGFYRGRPRPLRGAVDDDCPNWNIVPFHVWWWLSARCGFSVESLACARIRMGSVVTLALLFPGIAAATALVCASRPEAACDHRSKWRLLHLLLSRSVLLSENLVMRWRR